MKKESTKTQKSTPSVGVGVIGGMGTNIKSDSSDLDPSSSIGSSGGATPTHQPGAGDSIPSENGPGSNAGKDNDNDNISALNGGGDGAGSNLNDNLGGHKTPDSCGTSGGGGNATPTSHCDGGGAPPSVPSGSQDDTNGPPSQSQLHSQQQNMNNLDADADFLEAFDSKDGGE
jgi:hypothetical protein